MRVFITGATGFIGSEVVRDLRKAGYDVVGLVRSQDGAQSLVSAGATAVLGDLEDLEVIRREAQVADAVIHTAFDHDFSRMAQSCEIDHRVIETIGGALEGSGKTFVVTSGLPVIPGRAADENDVPPPTGMPRMSEQAAMSTLELGVRPMVIRMAQVHDETRQGFASYLLAHAREKGVSAYVGDGQNRWPTVHRLNAARLYRLALEKGKAGHRYHAVDEQGVPVYEIAETIGKGLGIPVISLAPEDSAEHFGWLDRIAQMNVPASSDFTQQSLGWRLVERSDFLTNLASATKPA